MQGFMDFIRKQGVMGLAVGFILGGAVSKVVSALVTDIINPIIGIFMGRAGNLANVAINVGYARIMLGAFISVLIDFFVVALVVYCGFKVLKLDKLDKKD
jgi:large conductance mechanosensitive channel